LLLIIIVHRILVIFDCRNALRLFRRRERRRSRNRRATYP